MWRRRVGEFGIVLTGSALLAVAAFMMIDSRSSALVAFVLLIAGPAWAYAFCWASTNDDFPEDARRSRDEWLRLLPWTFLLVPLVIPNVLLLMQFFRDSRADHGQTWLGWGRSRPGEDREPIR